MKKFLVLISLIILSSCNREPPTLKSPCVGAEGSPCVKRPANMQVIYTAFQA